MCVSVPSRHCTCTLTLHYVASICLKGYNVCHTYSLSVLTMTTRHCTCTLTLHCVASICLKGYNVCHTYSLSVFTMTTNHHLFHECILLKSDSIFLFELNVDWKATTTQGKYWQPMSLIYHTSLVVVDLYRHVTSRNPHFEIMHVNGSLIF